MSKKNDYHYKGYKWMNKVTKLFITLVYVKGNFGLVTFLLATVVVVLHFGYLTVNSSLQREVEE